MKKNIYKQIILFITVIAVLFVNMFSVYCSAASAVRFSIENIDNVTCSGTVNITLKIDCEQPITLNGFSIYLTFPEEQIEYVKGSAKSKISGIEGVTAYCSEGRVYYVWESDEAVNVSTGKFATFTFNTSGNFSGARVQLTVESMYYTAISGGKLVFNDIDFSPSALGNLNSKASDTDVQNVIECINNIGTVTFTDECKQKIDTAYNAYLNLSLSQRKNVTNYDDLAKAIKLYDQLKQSADYDASDEAVEKFLSDHASTLSLSLTSVTLNDLKRIEDALNDLKNLSVVAQSRLVRQKYQLNSLLEKAKELASGLEEEKKQQQLREEAELLADEFRNNIYSWTLKLTPETVTTDDETGVRAMLDELDGVAIMNDLAYEMLAPEKALLDSLLGQIEKLLILENPEDAEYIKEANRFKNNYSYILNLAPTEVTADDELYITIAYEVYNMLNDKTKSYLTNEGKILEELLDAVSNISLEEDDDDYEIIDSDNNQEIIETEKIIYREASGKDYLVKFSNKKLSKTVCIMITLAGIACINAAVLYIYFFGYKRRIKALLCKPDNEKGADI